MVNKGAISNNITMDLIYEILSRLPAKSISRFRCVSKQWMSIINSQYFKDLFHTKSSSNPSLLILVENKGQPLRFFSFPQPDSSSLMVVSDVRTMFSGHPIPYHCYSCYNKCKYVSGLIYFPGKAHAIYNPSMGQYAIYLPPAPKCCGMLGYDPIDKQFKVLIYKICYYDDLVYHILTIGTENERWREIKCPLTHYRTNVYNHICINGVLYYIAEKIAKKKDEDFNGELICCFDVRSEKFKFLYPNFIDEDPNTILINYKGKLSAIHEIYGDGGGFPFEIRMWVLEDVDEVVWKKYVYTLNESVNRFFDKPMRIDLFVVGATTSGDIVLTKRSIQMFYVLYFNPERNTLRCVEIKDVSEDKELFSRRRGHRVHYFVDHVENLGFDFMKIAYARKEASTSSSR